MKKVSLCVRVSGMSLRAHRARLASGTAGNCDCAVSESGQRSGAHLADAFGQAAAELYLSSTCMVKDMKGSLPLLPARPALQCVKAIQG